jgi:hypothetical protein
MASSIAEAFKQAILTKRPVRQDPNLALVAHCIAQALALTPTELAKVTAGVRSGIASGALKVTIPHDGTGRIDETKLPPLPKLPKATIHPQRPGAAVSERLVSRLVSTCATLTAKELTLVTQGVRAGLLARGAKP